MSLVRRYYEKLRQHLSDNHPRIYLNFNQRKSIIKFIVAGGLATFVDLVLLYFFHGIAYLNLVVSTSLAFIFAFLISFSLQKFWTFRNNNKDKVFSQLTVYMLNALFGLYLNGILMHYLVYRYAIWYLLAQIIVNLVISFWNFIVYKFIIFKVKRS